MSLLVFRLAILPDWVISFGQSSAGTIAFFIPFCSRMAYLSICTICGYYFFDYISERAQRCKREAKDPHGRSFAFALAFLHPPNRWTKKKIILRLTMLPENDFVPSIAEGFEMTESLYSAAR